MPREPGVFHRASQLPRPPVHLACKTNTLLGKRASPHSTGPKGLPARWAVCLLPPRVMCWVMWPPTTWRLPQPASQMRTIMILPTSAGGGRVAAQTTGKDSSEASGQRGARGSTGNPAWGYSGDSGDAPPGDTPSSHLASLTRSNSPAQGQVCHLSCWPETGPSSQQSAAPQAPPAQAQIANDAFKPSRPPLPAPAAPHT